MIQEQGTGNREWQGTAQRGVGKDTVSRADKVRKSGYAGHDFTRAEVV